MSTSRPRLQVTDTGTVRALLDRAAAAWPELEADREVLVLRLARRGAEHLPGPGDAASLPGDAHRGSWVAVRDERVLIAANTVTEVARWLRDRGERADELFRVPVSEDDVVAEHGLA